MMKRFPLEKSVFFATGPLFILWCLANRALFLSDDEGLARVLVGGGFAIALMLRRKPPSDFVVPNAAGIAARFALAGALLYLSGQLFSVNQAGWLGMLLLLAAVNYWGNRPAGIADFNRALFLLYWVHPLPGTLLGPVQLLMQRMSVFCAEWLLHIINVPVWADGLLLRAGLATYEIPAACSGMKTAVVVLLCLTGTSMLLNLGLSVWSFAGLGILGLVQVVFLNSVRIAFMVRARAAIPAAFLHDTGGIFLIAAILLMQFELALLKRWCSTRSERQHLKESVVWRCNFQFLWHLMFKWALVIVAVLAVVLAVYKRRPEHRAAMLSTVAEVLILSASETAPHAAEAALDLQPGNTEYRLLYARALMTLQRFEKALAVLEAVPPADRDAQFDIMRILVQRGAGRHHEIEETVESLEPGSIHPVQALLAAEIYAEQDDAGKCAVFVKAASASAPLVHRIRNLYPYLASRGKWDVIAATGSPLPFRSETGLLPAVTAHMVLGNKQRAGAVLLVNQPLVEKNPAFLAIVGQLAVSQPGRGWHGLFEAMLKKHIRDRPPRELYSLVDIGFLIGRPDLASVAAAGLADADSRHPAIPLVVAKYADALIPYRRRLLEQEAESEAADHPRDAAVWFLADAVDGVDADRKVPLSVFIHRKARECIALLEEGADPELLPRFKGLLLTEAYEQVGEFDKALRALEGISCKTPLDVSEFSLRRARLQLAQQRFQDAYESVRQITEEPIAQDAGVLHLRATSLIHMGFPFQAMHELLAARSGNRLTPALAGLAAGLLDRHGYPDEALCLLERYAPEAHLHMLLALCRKTGRWDKAAGISTRLGQSPVHGQDTGRIVPLPPAERAVRWVPSPVPASAEDGKESRHDPEPDRSPFSRKLNALRSSFPEDVLPEALAVRDAWEACGRDTLEKASALHMLAMLFAGKGDPAGALTVLDRAVDLLPDSAMLWRMGIALSNGDRDRIAAARQRCPADPEIWLADLVTRSAGGDRIPSAPLDEFPLETLIRAADYLLRSGAPGPSDALVVAALRREPASPVSLYAVGVNCALALGDRDLAIRRAVAGASLAPDEDLFQQVAVRLKMDAGQIEPSLIGMLRRMRERYPDGREWMERLGVAYFIQGNMPQSYHAFTPLRKGSLDGIQPGVCIMMAESARQTGRIGEAVAVLEAARALYPEKGSVLNNLIFTMALSETGKTAAQALLPALIALDAMNIAAYDTAVLVSYQAGDPSAARGYLAQALSRLDPQKERQWYDVSFNAAEAALRYGFAEEALRIYDDLIAAPRQPLISRPRLEALESGLEPALRLRAEQDAGENR